ncbi:MAG TPA: hypothetical protein VF252_05185 [Gemmatimonadales bacterium]
MTTEIRPLLLTSVRALALACLLLLPPGPAYASAPLPDSTGLQFLGFRAGARLDELAALLRSRGGARLRCRQSRLDSRVHECRASLREGERLAEVWISAMDSLAGVMTISAVVDADQLAYWRQTLEGEYGRVETRVQGSQSMLQWVRRGRMVRLTWRRERGEKVASVSLIDGHVLDGWGRSRAQSASTVQVQPASRIK